MVQRVRVAVNGYGVIGKRVADAVTLQEDMELSGVVDVVADHRIRVAVSRGYSVYAAGREQMEVMRAAGIPSAGRLEELLSKVDVVVDCTPKRVAAQNKTSYERAGVRAVFQGAEKHELTGFSFVAQVNYVGALGRQFVRVVSCNTTGLARVLGALHRQGWVKRARAVLMRRATDPWESHARGMINTVVPEVRVPSHQGPDVRTVIPDLDITTIAAAGPFNLSHIHFTMVETTRPVKPEEVHETLREAPRIAFVRADDGLTALNGVIELMRDLGRPRGDMWEVAVWEDAIASDGHDIYLVYQVHNEAIVIPETIDAIRAVAGTESDPAASIARTDRALGVTKTFLSQRIPVVTG